MLGNSLLLGAEDAYTISRSVRLRSSASASLNRTFSTPTDAKRQTLSLWMKRGILSSSTQRIADGYDGASANSTVLYPTSGNSLQFDFGGSAANSLTTTQVFRDPSAWYHIVIAVDTTQGTSSNRVLMYVNGVLITSFSSATYPALNATSQLFGSGANNRIGSSWGGGSNYFDGYLTEINFIDGQAQSPSAFGETDVLTGVWKPKRYAGTYGNNGFYLNFSDNSGVTATTIGKDYSGNSNNWTPNNISITAGANYDSMLDVPTNWNDGGNGRGNYCIINPLDLRPGSNAVSRTNGNLNVSYSTGGSTATAMGSMVLPSGKWYAEASYTGGTMAQAYVGVTRSDYLSGVAANTGQVFYIGNGQKRINGTDTAYGASFAVNDIIGMAVDTAAGTIEFFKNNVSQGVITSTTYIQPNLVCFADVQGSTTESLPHWWNFGQRPFSYTPPTGYKALNTQNFPEPTIKKGASYFDATTYTGNGGTLAITNSGGFQPDLVWGKSRSLAQQHLLFDSVRGVGNFLQSQATAAEAYDITTLSSFNSNGFTLGSNITINTNASTNVAWQWKEGAAAGFDIVTYTGTGAAQNISHSLGVAPRMMIVKARNGGATTWLVYHQSTDSASPGAYYLSLESTNARASLSTVWNNTAPTSSVFTVGSNAASGASSVNYVAYLFSEVAGFSKFGGYTGNGSADGPFVFCGVRPKWVMIKRTDTTADWEVLDTSRDSYNGMGALLNPNLSNAEAVSGPFIDVVSNGFKLRSTNAFFNASGGTYIFAAFAENPFKNSLAR